MTSARPLEARARESAARVGPAALVVLGLTVAVSIPPVLVESGPVVCPFRFVTGIPCPGCGLTRSVVALAHGDLSASLFFHPLGPAVVAVLVALATIQWLGAGRPRSSDQDHASGWGRPLLERLATGPLPWIATGALLVVWAVRVPLYLAGYWRY